MKYLTYIIHNYLITKDFSWIFNKVFEKIFMTREEKLFSFSADGVESNNTFFSLPVPLVL